MTIDRRANIPVIVGGGRVLCYTRLDERQVTRKNRARRPHGLAICEVGGGGIFVCTSEDDWIRVHDSWHATVSEANREAASEFEGVDSTWERPPL